MAVYSTVENKKDECLAKTLESLRGSVDFTKHRLMLSVNAYTFETEMLFIKYSKRATGFCVGCCTLPSASEVLKYCIAFGYLLPSLPFLKVWLGISL